MGGTGAKATYLTWEQAPDTVKFEVNTLFEQIYSLTNTPRISFENLKTMSTVSGIAFKFYFMGAHMAVENHAEDIGEFLQRRVNFLVSALGTLSSELYKPAKTIDIDIDIVPYMIDDTSGKVATAVSAISGGIWSRKHGMMFVGQIDNMDEELKEIEEEQTAKNNKIEDKEQKIIS